ncbi:MAG: alanine--tRNA ligase [Bacteroidia bacterium]|nr:MAG: alanine--tRNA ligase [Bacteroidia bacterium]
MLSSTEIRKSFLDFFASKNHKITDSAPMVVKDDPTLMFTNAGMNQFKNIFLGNSQTADKRVADTQKCLRVSGKHNDLEEVGHDTYHHTMFEMLGNWSFGDYFKKEVISWAWEYLTEILQIAPENLYATYFEGAAEDNLTADDEARLLWEKYLPRERILKGNKKDNFWEMGETGPCGSCSEIHIDLRSEEEKRKTPGRNLVNQDHPLVIEIWNLVFIRYNRKKNGQLEELPQKHVDTGMGFERLCMAVQGKKSNYDTDLFQPIIREIGKLTGKTYGEDERTDVAMRVIADHLRAVAFSITDGQLPSNTGAGYVIRRILRRAVRYAYTFLNTQEPLINRLLPVLIQIMGDAFPELSKQQNIIQKVILEEEQTFLRTLDKGIRLLDKTIETAKQTGTRTIDGVRAFVLYDTYGFPYDLTELILKENKLSIDKQGFDEAMEIQKTKSKDAAAEEKDDWNVLAEDDQEEFIGYDYTEAEVLITRWRKVNTKGKDFWHLVFNYTPFYAESGGQVGDTGYIQANDEKIEVIDTQKEHDVIIHITKKRPTNLKAKFKAVVNVEMRKRCAANHSATHLMHRALRDTLGTHVEQKGSLVNPRHLRFDFSHFQKMTPEEIRKVEQIVNQKIRQNIALQENREVPMVQARTMGAMALFGEKYGDIVRVIQFDDSIELCGGTHVQATGEIGYFKITSESSIAAGIRRIEAITSYETEEFFHKKITLLDDIASLLKNPKNIKSGLEKVLEENKNLKAQIARFEKEKIAQTKAQLKADICSKNGINLIVKTLDLSPGQMKDLAFQLKGEVENLFFAAATATPEGKVLLQLLIADNLCEEKEWHAGNIIRQAAQFIKGGGGGQAGFATAGGKDASGIPQALQSMVACLE